MVFDMYDYALQPVNLYKFLTAGVEKIQHASTPFILEGSISSHEETRGELAPTKTPLLKLLKFTDLAKIWKLEHLCWKLT